MRNDVIIAYRSDLDVIKGISILAVVLFHLGIVKSGYLGVDAFLVINGFLIIPSICRKMSEQSFSYLASLKKRVVRLLPMVVLVSFVCLLIGYVGMLPDDYENVGESVVASNLFSENLLLSITTKDYWNVSNDYNPLMHLWYVGVIFEFYVLYPVLLMEGAFLVQTVRLFKHNISPALWITTIILLVASMSVYLIPISDGCGKFYYIPYRLFEFLIGGLIGLLPLNGRYKEKKEKKIIQVYLLALLAIVMFSSLLLFDANSIGTDVLKLGAEEEIETGLILPKQFLLLATVIITTLTIHVGGKRGKVGNIILEYIGKRSYSIFIWH